MNVIKQGVHVPLSVVKQVAIIYAGVNGYLDDITPADIKRFQDELFEALDTRYTDFVKLFNKEKALTEEVKSQLDQLLKKFKEGFK
jgi:F-type H+-transporting ATPase subunit alpha